PGCSMIAEESTAWPGVTNSVDNGGLGFTFKWNMGWMHDTLKYFAEDPIHRRWHQDTLTFAMLYEYSERFVMPLSHDEVVHGKKSLLSRMHGDEWQRFANLRCLIAYQYTRPGKKLLFMGTELAPDDEWDASGELDMRLAQHPLRAGFGASWSASARSIASIRACGAATSHRMASRGSTARIANQSVLAYRRRFFGDELAVVLNLTPVPRPCYRVGVPRAGTWVPRLCSDAAEFGGSGDFEVHPVRAEPLVAHGHTSSIALTLPPLSALVLEAAG
ncbi:MAG: alpha amylase C-terminal domain-containing protein, partial [Myxococcota bacterium]